MKFCPKCGSRLHEHSNLVSCLFCGYEKKSLKHLTVRLSGGICVSVEDFLKSEQANSLGFTSRASFVTAAVRKFLDNLGFYDKK